MKRILNYLNPIIHLGERHHSIFFPLLATFLIWGILESIIVYVTKNPLSVGAYAIYLSIVLVVYFSFRTGIRGGLLTTALTIGYFVYIMYTRNFSGDQLRAGIQTTIILGLIFCLTSLIIGWLKEKIDVLIDQEADEKRRLQAIIQQLPVGVIITDRKGKIVQGNRHVDTILGRKMREGLIVGQKTISAKHKNKQVSPAEWPLAQAFNTGKPVIGKEITIENSDGRKKHLQVSASLIHNKRGEVIAAASITNDITDQKEMEERKDDFVNMASHELKTPLTSMKLYLDALHNKLKKSEDKTTLKILLNVKNQTQRLQELVNDLLDVSRLQTGKLNFNKEEFRIDTLVSETIDSLREMSKNQELKYSGKTPIKVYGDKFRIYQVITNLITNAIKYSPEGTDILIKVKKVEGKVIVSVQDSGIGIVKEQHQKIFNRLYQVTDPEVKTFPGLGMGLYISKEIVRRHKGRIWVESPILVEKSADGSKKGRGSIFYFSLPLVK